MSVYAKVPSELPQFARETTPERPWPLRLLNVKIAEYISKMSRLWVEGEIITLVRRPNSKIQFFTLADLEEKSAINCKIFTHNLPDGIESGARVVVCAKPDYWTGSGALSLHVDDIRAVGIGDILARIEALKKRLAAEGLFDPQRKKPLPFLPHRIGLIVGRNTKALHDVQVNTRARWAAAEFEVREVLVQGPGAVEAMLPALAELDADPAVDVIVFARGGGSVEDLLPFSDERLLRAVAAATTPIVSAIGHETDNPLLDLVADFRASTPTDAAKNIVPDVTEEKMRLRDTLRRGRIATDALLTRAQTEIETLRSRPIMAEPELLISARAEDLANLQQWARTNFDRVLTSHEAALHTQLGRLRTLSPLSTLERGYCVIIQEKGTVVSSTDAVQAGDPITARLRDGYVDLEVIGTRKTYGVSHERH
ncbi:MAG: exodeoxyribonuclease VII large subunit [Actinomycetaceae bacterium]|nr:exodeoxyribonuclease VII large subunit [Actinomycetaceae bacterium]